MLTALSATTIPYEEIACDPNFADTAEFCAHYGYSTQRTANTIIVASRKPEGRNAACVLLATTRLDVNKVVRSMLGVRKVSFATSDLTSELTGMAMGGVTPFGLPKNLPLWIDSRVVKPNWIILGGGSRSLKIKVDPAVLITIGGKVVQDLANPMKSTDTGGLDRSSTQ